MNIWQLASTVQAILFATLVLCHALGWLRVFSGGILRSATRVDKVVEFLGGWTLKLLLLVSVIVTVVDAFQAYLYFTR